MIETKKDYRINDIEALTYAEVEKIAKEKIIIKNHECFLVDFDGYFGYSICVFLNKKHIYYANDYQLHHPGKTESELKKYYIEGRSNVLFTENELMDNIKNYNDYDKKMYYLTNYWIMQFDYLSMFATDRKEEKNNYPLENPYSFCYVKDKSIIDREEKLYNHLNKQSEKLLTDSNLFRGMVRYELANHEACITYDCTETLNSLGLTMEKLTIAQQQIVQEELNNCIREYENRIYNE